MKWRFAAPIAIGVLLLPQAALAQGALIVPNSDGSAPSTTSVAPLIRPGDDDGPTTTPNPLFRMGDDEGAESSTSSEPTTESELPERGGGEQEQEPLTANFVETHFEDRGTHRYLDATCNLGQHLNEYREEFGKDPQECKPGETVQRQAPEPEGQEQVDDDVSSRTSEEAPAPEEVTPTEEAPETTTEQAPPPAPAAPAAPPAAPPAPSGPPAGATSESPAPEENGEDATEAIKQAASDARATISDYLAVNQGTIKPEDGEMFAALYLLAQTDGTDAAGVAAEAGDHGDTVLEFESSNAEAIPDWKQRMDLDKQLSGVGEWGEKSGVDSAAALEGSYNAMKAIINGGN